MLSPNQNLKALIAQGNLESALETLVRLTEHAEDADLRQRVLTLSGQFSALKKHHLTNLLDDKDYRLQLNRITAAVVEIVDGDSKALTQQPIHRVGLPKDLAGYPFWQKWKFWAWFIPVLLATLEVIFGGLSYLLQSGSPLQKEPLSPSKALCNFPTQFDSTHLYILITRFEDNANTDLETKCYGEEIESRIDQIKYDEKLPIKICYIDDDPPNQIEEVAQLRDDYHADLIIWGNLRNAKPDCQSDGFCIKYQASKTLIQYAGGQVPQKVDNEYQPNISNEDIEDGLIRMGKISFKAWVIGMSNLKIGRKKPEFYRISSDLPTEEQAGEYATRGDMFFRLGLFEKTIQDYDQAIQLVPSAVFYNNRAVANERLGRFHETISDCDKAIQFDSNHAPAYHNRGYANLKLNLFNAAIADYNKAIQLNPNDFVSYNDRGGAKNNLGQYEAAIADYNKAIQLKPNLVDAFNNRGATKNSLKQYKEANADYDKAIEIDPNYALAYFNRGSLKRNLGKHKEAIDDLSKCIQFDSNNTQAYNLRGATNYDLNLYQDAIADLDKFIQLDSTNSGVYSVRGHSKTKLDLNKSAIADFDRSIQLDPNEPNDYDNRGGAKSEIGDYTAAIIDFDKAIQLNPKNVDYYFHRAIAKNGLRQYQAAINDFDKVFQLMPDAWIYNERGISKIKLGKYKEGVADFDRAIQINPNDSKAYQNKANANWQQKKYFVAIRNFYQAFRVRYLPGWKMPAVWILIIGLFIFWRFKINIQNYIQNWKQRVKRKTTRQEKRQSIKKKRK